MYPGICTNLLGSPLFDIFIHDLEKLMNSRVTKFAYCAKQFKAVNMKMDDKIQIELLVLSDRDTTDTFTVDKCEVRYIGKNYFTYKRTKEGVWGCPRFA